MPRSQAEVKLAHSVIEGNAKDAGMDPAYAKEVVSGMHGKKMASLPPHAPPKNKGKKYKLGKKVGKKAGGGRPF
jgi:hypothetical protein